MLTLADAHSDACYGMLWLCAVEAHSSRERAFVSFMALKVIALEALMENPNADPS